jgi:HK97 gp10 family phage protein
MYELKGNAELMRDLASLPWQLQKKILRPALRAGVHIVAQAVKFFAPRRSGLTVSAVKVRAVRRNRRGTIGVNVILGAGDYRGDTFYASFLEYGHFLGKRTNSTVKKLWHLLTGRSRRWIEPRPFIRPAFDMSEPHATEEIESRIWEGVKAHLKK